MGGQIIEIGLGVVAVVAGTAPVWGRIAEGVHYSRQERKRRQASLPESQAKAAGTTRRPAAR